MTVAPYNYKYKKTYWERCGKVGVRGGYGSNNYRVPTLLLRDFMFKHAPELNDPDAQDYILWETPPWRGQLAFDMSRIMRTTEKNTKRRIYSIEYLETPTTGISYAEALVMAFGLDLDQDTNIPTLPGCITLAVDLVSIRAELAGDELEKMELRRISKRVLRLSSLISAFPHHTQLLADMAPYNCLRPY